MKSIDEGIMDLINEMRDTYSKYVKNKLPCIEYVNIAKGNIQKIKSLISKDIGKRLLVEIEKKAYNTEIEIVIDKKYFKAKSVALDDIRKVLKGE